SLTSVACKDSNNSTTFCTSSKCSELSINGQITYACLPFFNSADICCNTLSYDSCLDQEVIIGFLPFGNCLIEDTSISPKTEIANVRGIGVAVINKTFVIAPFSLSNCR